MNNQWSTTVTDWQGVDDEPTAGSDNLVKSGGVAASLSDAIIQKKETSATNNARYYITDENKVILGYIDASTGAKYWIQKNEEELHASDIIERVSSEIEVEGYDGYKFLTDNNGVVIGYIDTKGGVYFCNLLNQSGGQGKSDDVTFMMNTVANGGKGPKVLNIMNSLPKKSYTTKGYSYKTTGFMSFHDDDTIDWQIPVSHDYNATPETRIDSNVGGFASFLYPFMKSITERHKQGKKLVPNATTKGYDLVDDQERVQIKGKLVYGLAAEGHRIGLMDRVYSDIDSFDGKLNLCGELASKLYYKYGWDIMCHSMTARYIAYSYLVDSITDPIVAEIEAAATKHIQNSWENSYIHCTDTNLDYEYRIDDNNHGEWHLVSDQYIRPYLAKSLNSNAPLYFNPRYSEVYQVGEWRKRAQVAGLPFIDCGVSWGTSASKKNQLIRDDYFKDWCATGIKQVVNEVPWRYSGFSRATCFPTDNTNRWQESKFAQLKNLVDQCLAIGGWLVLAGHVYEFVERNYYLSSVDYGDRRCDSYPNSWIVPLKQEELEAIDENNYWEIPPARLGINSWAEWYPCPGTTYDMLMNVIEYAISQGMEFGSTEEALRRYANNFHLGLKLGAAYTADQRLADSEKDPTWDNYIIQGADGSIDYHIV